MIEFKVEVSSEDIIEAKGKRCNPLILSLKRAFPGAFLVSIDSLDCGQSLAGDEKEVYILGNTFSMTFHLPKEALSFLTDFNAGKFVHPFGFIVTMGGK